jgi:hypothetical protein
MNDYAHPDGGRIYREGDPAHLFAVLARILAEQARQYIDHHERRMADRDYLGQHATWQSDPDRIARSMAHTIASLDKAYTAVVVDRDLPSYGLGQRDEDWQRKYGGSGTVAAIEAHDDQTDQGDDR